jgi:hypothetical protein
MTRTNPKRAVPAEALERILIELRDTSRSHIVLAAADDPGLRTAAMTKLEQALSATYRIHRFDYARVRNLSLPRSCRRLRGRRPNCVFGFGLEELQVRRPEAFDEALGLLNLQREDIRDTKTALVLWLSRSTHQTLLAQAPDFAAWVRAVVAFQLAGEPAEVKRPPSPIGGVDRTRVEAEVAAEAARHIRDFEKMLARPNLDPGLRAEFERRLAEARQGP